MRLIHFAWLPALLVACTDLPDRLDEADVAIPGDCSGGSSDEIKVSGTVVDRETQAPVAGAKVDITEAWAGYEGFPKAGCRLGTATTGADGRFGPIKVHAGQSDPTIVMLVTGAGRAPTIADHSVGCLFGCSDVDERIAAPSAELATQWREELYAGGMKYALNRGLVAYTFQDSMLAPASRVTPMWYGQLILDPETHEFERGAEVRFLDEDAITLTAVERTTTTRSGQMLLGYEGNLQGYYNVVGVRSPERWAGVGVIVATGWIYIETSGSPP